MRLGVQSKLIFLGVLVILVVSSGFTWVNLSLARRAIEEDLKVRAIIYAREVAAAIGDPRELESEPARRQVARLLEIRPSVLQLDLLSFGPSGGTVVATNEPKFRLAFSKTDADQVRQGRVLSRLIHRHWEILAPIRFEGAVAGAVAVKFATDRADLLAARIRFWAFTLTAASVVVMAFLMGNAIQLVVNRPVRRFMAAVSRATPDGVPSPVAVATKDEFGVLAYHFNEMVARIGRFNEELRARVDEATEELDRRYRQVEGLNALLFTMQRRLGHAERLALSGRVMAEVAHEVGTPLHSVAGHLELLRQDLPPAMLTEDVTRRLTIIEAQVARVIEIIATLLDVTRRVPGEPGAVDVERLARDTGELIRPGLARSGVSLEIQGESGRCIVQGRADQLQQVILNLLTNAVDATPAGGRIEVTVRTRPANGEVEIAITDTGPGIPAAIRARMFEAFYSTKEPGRGTGLGLFITAQIVQEHKGQIEVESREAHGSTFRVVLPAAGAQT